MKVNKQFLSFAINYKIGNDQESLNLVLAGKADLLFIEQVEFVELLKAAHQPATLFEIAFTVLGDPLYIGFSKDVDTATVSAWQRTLDAMTKDGTFNKLRQ